MANKDFLVRMKADTSNYDANLSKAKAQLNGFAKSNLSAGGAIKQLTSSMVGVAAQFASVTAAVGAFTAAIKSNIQTAKNFEKSMSQLSSLTGMVGSDLDKLKDYAIELGSKTTLSASQVADAFKMIGSQQPQLLQSKEALKSVTEEAIKLAEAAGIDLATAAQTLSTSINQMGGDSNNAARYVNVLAAASQKGAGDIAWLGEALTKSATAAKAVGTEYEELVANLEQLAKAGFDASTAGTALRSIIMNLEKKASNEMKPSVVGLTKAFENLGKANLDLSQYQDLVGKMFASQAKVLAEAAGEAKNMTEAITGTNTAEEQAKTNTDNLSGSILSLQSAWEGFNLHLNSSNGLLRDFVDLAKNAVQWADRYLTTSGRQAGFRDDLTNKKTTKMFGRDITGVVANLQRLGGSNYKGQVYREIQQMYNEAILAGVKYINEHTQEGSRDRKEAQASLDAIKSAQEEFTKRARKMLGLDKDTPTTTNNTVNVNDNLNDNETKTYKPTNVPKPKPEKDPEQELTDIFVDLEGKVVTLAEGATGSFVPTLLQSLKDKLTTQMAEKNAILDETTFGTLLKTAVENGLEGLDIDFEGFQEKMGEGLDIPDEAWKELQDKINEKLKELGLDPIQLDLTTGELAKKEKEKKDEPTKMEALEKQYENTQKVVSGLSSVASGLQQMGIKLPEGVTNVLNGIQGAMSVIQGVMSIIQVFQTSTVTTQIATQTANTSALLALTAAVGANTAALGVNTATSFIPFARGGIVKAAEGYVVPGHEWSLDRVPALLSSGEMVLNRAQQGNLASALQGGGAAQGGGTPYVSGETVFLGSNNFLKRTGQGEIVTTRMLRKYGIG